MKQVLKGRNNLEIYQAEAKATRKVMSLPLLKLLGHEIAKCDWNKNSKQIVWTAFTMAFFGCFRMGELLAKSEKSYCPEDTLLWKDVKFVGKDHIIIHVKCAKSRRKEGEFVDLFQFEGHKVCPVKALQELKNSSSGLDLNMPVFRFSNGLCLTIKSVNGLLTMLLEPYLGENSKEISAHSFRAGIPAVLARFPNESNTDEIMGWGRWKSKECYTYTRLRTEQKRATFFKIMDFLNR